MARKDSDLPSAAALDGTEEPTALQSDANVRFGLLSHLVPYLQTLFEVVANRGAANGYAPLDAGSLIPSVYLPSYVDDIVEAADYASLPGTGEAGKIYLTLDDNHTFRWSGSAYVDITNPGTTDDITEGATNLYHTLARVLGAVLTGFSSATSTLVTSADTVLQAIGKLQGQLLLKGDRNAALLDMGDVSGAQNIDLTYRHIRMRLVGNVVLTFTGLPAAGTIAEATVEFVQDGTGGRTVTQPTGTARWPNGVVPVISAGANQQDDIAYRVRSTGDFSGYPVEDMG